VDRQAIHSRRVQEKSTALHIAAEIEVSYLFTTLIATDSLFLLSHIHFNHSRPLYTSRVLPGSNLRSADPVKSLRRPGHIC
jgi:hypothetical protein